MKCHALQIPSADEYLSIQSGYPKDAGKTCYSNDQIAKVERLSREIASYSLSGTRSWIEPTSESPVLRLRGGGSDDVDSLQLFNSVSPTEIAKGSNAKLSWADQVEDEVAAGFEAPLPKLWPALRDANSSEGLDLHVSPYQRQEPWRSARSTASEAKTKEDWRSEKAVHEKPSQYALPSPSPLNSSNKTRSRSYRHRIKGLSGSSSEMQPELSLKYARRVSPDPEAQPQMGQMSSARVPDLDVLIRDKKDDRSATTSGRQDPQTTKATSWLQQDQPLGWSKDFPPQKQPVDENNGQTSSKSPERTLDRVWHGLPKTTSPTTPRTREAQEQVPHRFDLPSTTTAQKTTDMTWAQKVKAGGLGSTFFQKPKDTIWRPDRPQNSLAGDPSFSKVGSAKESSNIPSSALNSVGLSSQSTIADTSRQPTVLSEFAEALTAIASTAPSSTSSPLGQQYRVPLEWDPTHESRQQAEMNVSPAQNGDLAPSETVRISSAGENDDKDPKNDSHPSPHETTKDGDASGSSRNEWQIVGRKSRASQPARPSKAKNYTQRTMKLSKRTIIRPAAVDLSLVQVTPPALSTPKAWPNLQTHSSSPPPHLLPTLKKPSYAAVASLRSPLLSFSSSTSSSADTPFVSAPQTPEQPASTSGTQLVSPYSSDAYFSAAEDMDTLRDSPVVHHTPLEHSDTCGDPATSASATIASDDSLTPKQFSRETSILALCDEQGIPGQGDSVRTLESRGGRPPCSNLPTRYEDEASTAAVDCYEEDFKPAVCAESRSEDAARALPRSRQSSSRRSQLSTAKSTLSKIQGNSSETAPETSLPKTSKKYHGGRSRKRNKKAAVSSESAAQLDPQKAKEGCKDTLPLSSQEASMITTTTPPATLLSSIPRQPLRAASVSSQRSPTKVPFLSPKRGRAAEKISHESSTGTDMPREGSILRGEAPEFTPQTTPSKPKPSPLHLDSSVHSRHRLPDEWTESPVTESLEMVGGVLIQPTPSSLPGAKSSESTLTPWMSKEYWMLKKGECVERKTSCCGVRGNTLFNSNEQTVTVWNTLERFGQIRRLKPCGTIKVEQAMEQIGRWCSECDPDH
ncbi:MAG: hypothetical protein M1830_000270 [Pleopsidium flavum]|nr:MAG: hypothetical protein M1830_000270 [Pleopsidium flavum]